MAGGDERVSGGASPATVVAAEGSGALRAGGVVRVDPEVFFARGGDPAENFRLDYLRLLVLTAGPAFRVASRPLRTRLENAGHAAPDPASAPAPRSWQEVRALGAERYPLGRAARRAHAVGSLVPRLLLVGERELAPRGTPFRAPSGRWLLAALAAAGYDPLEVLLVNALLPDGKPNEQLGELLDAAAALAPGFRLVALGEVARGSLVARGARPLEAPHPAWHRRFRHGEGPAGYARLLLAEGLATGFYRTSSGWVAPAGVERASLPRGEAEVPEPYRGLLGGTRALVAGTGEVDAWAPTR